MDTIERTFSVLCICAGIAMFVLGVWHLVGGLKGLRLAWTHIKDWLL